MRIPIEIGGCTLVGVGMYKSVYDKNGKWIRNVIDHDKFPLNHGNCFDLKDDEGKYHRVINFCYENLQEWMRRTGQKDIDVECIPKSDRIWMIVDERIPKEWYNKDWCTVCTPLRMLPFEQRKSYLKSLSGIRKHKLEDGSTMLMFSRKLPQLSEEERKAAQERLSKWTFEVDQDVKAYHSVDAEDALKGVLAAFKGRAPMEEGTVYAPYIPLVRKPRKLKASKKGLMTKYAAKIINPDYYGKIIPPDEEKGS